MNFDSKILSKSLVEKLKQSPRYVSHYRTSDDTILFKMNLSEAEKQTIVQPLLSGNFSKVDRTFVNQNFPKIVYNSQTRQNELSSNLMILNKDPYLKIYWEKRINVKLPEDAEVWSKPLKENEIYGLK